MNEAPRPHDSGEDLTSTSRNTHDQAAAADPASKPGLSGTVARYPLWVIIGVFVVVALLALFIARVFVPAGP
jgi:hypothetical protein